MLAVISAAFRLESCAGGRKLYCVPFLITIGLDRCGANEILNWQFINAKCTSLVIWSHFFRLARHKVQLKCDHALHRSNYMEQCMHKKCTRKKNTSKNEHAAKQKRKNKQFCAAVGTNRRILVHQNVFRCFSTERSAFARCRCEYCCSNNLHRMLCLFLMLYKKLVKIIWTSHCWNPSCPLFKTRSQKV